MNPPSPPRWIAGQMAFAFGSIAAVAVVMCVFLLGIVSDVSALVSGMRHDETSIRRGLELANAVREQHIHITSALLQAGNVTSTRYDEWRQKVRAHIQEIAEAIPERERWRLLALAEKTQRMHERFLGAALPAAREGNLVETRKEHQAIEALAYEASEHADALARAVESKMAHAHVLATNATQRGLIGGALSVSLVVLLSIAFTLRLRRAVLQPLVKLTEAAGRFGNGDFSARVGNIGKGELAALAQAFDHMAEELARRQARLLHSERMAAIGQLAAGVAHELNNPIGIIRGYLKTMDPKGDPEALREELAILDEEASHCQRIAEDLVAYSRTLELTREKISMRGFLQESARRFQEGSGVRGRTVEVNAEAATLEADATRLRQVLMNLLGNAVQASPETSIVTVRGQLVGAPEESETDQNVRRRVAYQIDVIDSGPGVSETDRERIFEPFFSRRRGGSGLGLSVCLGIVRAHAGTLTVLDNPEGGAIFRVRLPLYSKPEETPS